MATAAIDRNAADGACGDESRRMLEREDRVGGAGRGRQRTDQRADERARAFDRYRGDDDDRRRHHHFQSESVPEDKIGRHGADYLRLRLTSTGGPLLMV